MRRWGAILVVMSLALAALPMAAGAVTPPGPDLSIEKVAEQESVTVGGNAGFTITVTNESAFDAFDVSVSDTAFRGEGDDGGATIVFASGDGWECGIEGNSATCFLFGALSPGETSSDLLVVVQATGSPGTLFDTAITASGIGEDPDPSDNSQTVSIPVEPGGNGSVETFLNGEAATLTTTGGQTGWNATMRVPAGSPPGIYRLTEIADIPNSKGAVEYQAPEGAVVEVDVICNSTQCPKRRILDLLVIVIKTDDNGQQHLLLPCHLVIKIKGRNIVIDRNPPCVVSVTRANTANAPLIWTTRLLGGPDPGVKGR